jgi:hypothetical protein
VSNSEDKGSADDSDSDSDSAPPVASTSTSRAGPEARWAEDRAKGARPNITSYFRIETTVEKAERMEREAREYAEQAEENRLREVEAKRRKAARKRVQATERMHRYRERARNLKIAEGWIPGQKRVSSALSFWYIANAV